MSKPDQILPARLRTRLDATGKSMRGLSLEIGAHSGYVRDLFDPDRFNMPKLKRLQALAAALETTPEYLLGNTDNPQPVRSEVGVQDMRQGWNALPRVAPASAAGIPLVGTGDCAEIELCDETGAAVAIERSSFDPEYHVRYLARPRALGNARDIYAISFWGESMVPRFRPGEVGLVDPNRPPVPGDDVVVQLRADDSDEVASVLVKQLVRRTASELLLHQHNPATTFAVPARQVVRVHRIVPQTELLF